jgi:hypothetical protein
MLLGDSQTSRAGFHIAIGLGTPGEETSDILDHHHSRAECPDRVLVVRPKAGTGAGTHALASAGEGEVLAGEPATQPVDGFNLGPVDGGHVPMIRNPRPPGREHLRRGRVVLDMPHGFRVEECFHGEIEAADTREEGTEPQHQNSPSVRSGATTGAHTQ